MGVTISVRNRRRRRARTRRIRWRARCFVGATFEGRRDVTDRSDLRVLFPTGDPLLMGERGGVDHLERIDPITLQTTDTIDTSARYHGTRLSPSKKFLAVADVSQDPSPIHVVDLDT